MTTLIQWLSEPAGPLPFEYGWIPFGLPATATRLQLYACLVGMNGGRVGVSGWGCTSNAGLYRRSGLEMNDAMHLMQMSAFIEGWLCATAGSESVALSDAMNAEWARVEALREAEEAASVAAQNEASK